MVNVADIGKFHYKDIANWKQLTESNFDPFLAMERAQTSEVETSVEIIIVAIVSGFVVVGLVAVIVYMGCFKNKPAATRQRQQQGQQQQDGDENGKSKSKQKKRGKGHTKMSVQRILPYFVRGSINVQLTSSVLVWIQPTK